MRAAHAHGAQGADAANARLSGGSATEGSRAPASRAGAGGDAGAASPPFGPPHAAAEKKMAAKGRNRSPAERRGKRGKAGRGTPPARTSGAGDPAVAAQFGHAHNDRPPTGGQGGGRTAPPAKLFFVVQRQSGSHRARSGGGAGSPRPTRANEAPAGAARTKRAVPPRARTRQSGGSANEGSSAPACRVGGGDTGGFAPHGGGGWGVAPQCAACKVAGQRGATWREAFSRRCVARSGDGGNVRQSSDSKGSEKRCLCWQMIAAMFQRGGTHSAAFGQHGHRETVSVLVECRRKLLHTRTRVSVS